MTHPDPAKEGLAKRLLALADLGGMSDDDVRDLRQAADLIASPSRVREETVEEMARIADADASTRKFTEGRGVAIKIAAEIRCSLKSKGPGQ